MLEWIYCVKAEYPPENSVPQDKYAHQGHQKYTRKRGMSITKKFTGGPTPLARAKRS